LGGPKYKKDKTPTSRYLHGTVTDDTNQPVQGALVTLTNNKTKEKLTFITKKDGRYHFDDLSFTVDYGVQARYKNEASELRKISQYDNRPDVVRMLELQSPEEAAKKP
jgi:Carboxypeptidase regulatory-like domain